jgi:restriction system protein
MPVPTWQEFMVPTLEVLRDGQVRRLRELYALVANKVGLSESERAERLSAGDIKHENRIGWATSYLTRVAALDRPSRGQYVITEVGRKLLTEHPYGITEQDLRTLAEGNGQPRYARALEQRHSDRRRYRYGVRYRVGSD